jgi:hypothetical protein
MATQTDDIQTFQSVDPDRPRTGMITYDAKYPDTKYSHRGVAPAESRPRAMLLWPPESSSGSWLRFFVSASVSADRQRL